MYCLLSLCQFLATLATSRGIVASVDLPGYYSTLLACQLI